MIVEIIETDNSPLEIIDTPYGKIAFLICFDMDHHELPLEASEADIIFVVSNDWPAMDPLHTQMASITGIANGYSVIRPTGRGLSVASDYRGVIASQVDVYPFDIDGNMVATVNSLTTLYNKARAMAYSFWKKFPYPSFLKVISHEVNMRYLDPILGVELEGTIDLV